jgi:hypothetical protein
MQEVFNRERNKRRKGPEAWTHHGTDSGWHQEFQRDDWYYKTESQNDNQRTKYQSASKQKNYAKSHHYTILGLDRYSSQLVLGIYFSFMIQNQLYYYCFLIHFQVLVFIKKKSNLKKEKGK